MWGNKRFNRRRENKMGAVKTNGRASKLENAVAQILEERQRQGIIKDLREQHSILLLPGTKRTDRITWKVDFSYTVVRTGLTELAEAKGFATDVYKLKLKLYKAIAPFALEIWKGNYRSPLMVERIEANTTSSK